MLSINAIISLIICFAKFTDPICDVTDGNHPDGTHSDRGFSGLDDIWQILVVLLCPRLD